MAALLRGALRDLALPHAAWNVFLFCLSGPFFNTSGFPGQRFLPPAVFWRGIFATWRALTAAGRLLAWRILGGGSGGGASGGYPVHSGDFVCICGNQRVILRALVTQVATLAVAGLVLVAPYEFWTITEFGLPEKVERNPAMHYRKPGVSLTATTLENLETTFVPQAQPMLTPLTIPDYPAFDRWVWRCAGFSPLVAIHDGRGGHDDSRDRAVSIARLAYWRSVFPR